MSGPFLTVAEAAERLKLHERTVLRFIRDGRLRASKVGKQYRILPSDLAALAGGEPSAGRGAEPARATSIVDVPDVDADLARRLAILLPSVRAGASAAGELMNIDLAYDPARRHLKIVLVGSPAETAAMLGLISTWLQQSR
jgi:excisionase family DNA binding protein